MFTARNCPKSYGSIMRGAFRLQEFSHLPTIELNQIEADLWNFISKNVESSKPLDKLNDYKFIGAGWEWSVFQKDENTLIKVPAQIFNEVSDRIYLENTKFAYKTISAYFPDNFIAKTKFKSVNNTNVIEQDFIRGDESFLVDFRVRDKLLIENLINFLKLAKTMLKQLEWLPDFSIKKLDDGFNFQNVIIEEKTRLPKIIDFTAYYDVYRLYQERTKLEVVKKGKRIDEFLRWLENV